MYSYNVRMIQKLHSSNFSLHLLQTTKTHLIITYLPIPINQILTKKLVTYLRHKIIRQNHLLINNFDSNYLIVDYISSKLNFGKSSFTNGTTKLVFPYISHDPHFLLQGKQVNKNQTQISTEKYNII